jgi:CelD/BcsL family acetyltransferase involved in cellulose biosynthesis
MVVTLLRSVNEIRPQDWRRLSEPGVLFESRDWLSVNEESFTGQAVVTAEFSGGGLESLIIWRAVDGNDTSPYYNIAALLARLTGQPAPVNRGWTLNCVGSGMHSPMLAAPGVAFSAARLRAHMAAAAAAESEPPAMCGFNFMPRVPAPGLPRAFTKLGLREIAGYRRAFLPLNGNSYEDYLASLTSRQRWNARRDRRRFAEAGQRTSIATGPLAAGEDLVWLQGCYRRKYSLPHDADELRERHLTLLRCAQDDGLVIRSYQGGRCTGFAMFFRMRNILHALFAGFEPHGERVGPYFECLFHAAIEWACRHGITEIDYGIGATMAKSERGCQIDAVSTWYLSEGQRPWISCLSTRQAARSPRNWPG